MALTRSSFSGLGCKNLQYIIAGVAAITPAAVNTDALGELSYS